MGRHDREEDVDQEHGEGLELGERGRDVTGKLKASRRQELLRSLVWWSVPPLFGFLVPWLTLVVVHHPLFNPGSRALQNGDLKAPDPTTCEIGTCWDGAAKYGYNLCGNSNGVRGRVRGYEVQRDQKFCYRSLFINQEENTAYAVGVMFFFVYFTGRLFEHVAEALVQGDLRWHALLSLVCGFPCWYYSASVAFIYVNEFYHHFLSSQAFFTVSECAFMTIMGMHIRKSTKPYLELLALVAVTATCHAIQIILDESSSSGFFRTTQRANLRNVVLIIGDIGMLAGSLSIVRSTQGGWQTFKTWSPKLLGLLLVELVLFQLFFANVFSFSISRMLGMS